jgi:hypothetical protein
VLTNAYSIDRGRDALDGFSNRILTLADTKNGKTRHIPLNDGTLAAFRALEKTTVGDYVFLRDPGHACESRHRRQIASGVVPRRG